MTLDLGAVLDLLRAHFERHESHWAIAGGLAIGAYGVARTTFDVDVVVPRDHQSTLVDFLESEGFETLHRSFGFSNHLHRQRGRVDVIYVDTSTADQLFGATADRVVLGRSLPVPAVEHLIAMKIVAYKNDPGRRLQDLSDIRRLVIATSLGSEQTRSIFRRYDLEADAEHV